MQVGHDKMAGKPTCAGTQAALPGAILTQPSQRSAAPVVGVRVLPNLLAEGLGAHLPHPLRLAQVPAARQGKFVRCRGM